MRSVRGRRTESGDGSVVEDFFDVADFALNFAAGFFHGAAVLQITIPSGSAGGFFDFAFGFQRPALDFVFRARFHNSNSFRGGWRDASTQLRQAACSEVTASEGLLRGSERVQGRRPQL